MLEKIKNVLGLGGDDRDGAYAADRGHLGDRSIRADRDRHRRTIDRKKSVSAALTVISPKNAKD